MAKEFFMRPPEVSKSNMPEDENDEPTALSTFESNIRDSKKPVDIL